MEILGIPPKKTTFMVDGQVYNAGTNIEKRKSMAMRKATVISKKKPQMNKGVLSAKNKEIIRRVYMQIRVLNYLRKPKKTKIKMKKTLMKLGLLQDVEKKVTKQRKEDYYDIDNFDDLEDIIHNFLENKLDPSKKEIVELTIYPNSTFKKVWDILIVGVMLYICTIFPYRICFLGMNDANDSDALFWFDIGIDIFFFADIILNFFFAVEKEGIIIDRKNEIAKIYLKSWFVPDIVSIIPFYLINSEEDQLLKSNNNSVLKIFKFFRLIKSVRIFKGNPVFDRLMFNLKLSVITKQILKNLLFLIFFIHLIGCIWHYLGNFGSPDTSWLYPIGLYDEDNFTKYLTSIYFALVVSFTVGYGDITPISYTETIFVVFYLIIGVSLYAYTISNLTSLFGRLSARDNYLQEKENAIKLFAINHNLSDELYLEIRNYLIDNDTKQSNFLFEKQLISNVNELTDYLPPNLYYELYVNNFKKQLKKLPLLQNCDDKFYLAFISIFEIRLFNKNDILFKPGDPAEQVYIVWKGRFCMINSLNFENYEEYKNEGKKSLYTTGAAGNRLWGKAKNIHHRRKMQEELLKIMTYYNSNDMFGENDLKKSAGKIRKFTVKAKKDSVVIVLYKNDIKYLCELNSDFKFFFEESQKRKEKVIKLIFDSYKKKFALIGNIEKNLQNLQNMNEQSLLQKSSSLVRFNSKLTITSKLLKMQSGIDSEQDREELLRMLADNREYSFLEKIAPETDEKKTPIVKSSRKKLFSYKTDGNFYCPNNSFDNQRDFVKKMLNTEDSYYPSSPMSINKSSLKIVKGGKNDTTPFVLHKMKMEGDQTNLEADKSFHSETVSPRKSDTRNLIIIKKHKTEKSEQTELLHSLSMIELPVKINLDNFENKIADMRKRNKILNIKLMKMLKQKKFQIIKSDIFPAVHEVNIKIKEIFDLMRNFIYQFEEVRRKFSVNTPDTIREARQSINDFFSMYYETIEILNKLGTVNMTETLEMLSLFTKKAVLFMEQRFNMIQTMSSINNNRNSFK